MEQDITSNLRKVVLLIESRSIIRIGITLALDNLKIDICKDKKIYSQHFLLPEIFCDLVVASVDGVTPSEQGDLMSKIKNRYRQAKIIFYSCEQTDSTNLILFTQGLNGYVSGNFTVEELRICIERVLAGDTFIIAKNPNVSMVNYLEFRYSDKLSPRQSIVASYLSEGMTTSEIAKLLKKKPSTISTFKTSILKKMDIKNVIELARIMKMTDGQKYLN